jgi:serine/threonine-protein kinase
VPAPEVTFDPSPEPTPAAIEDVRDQRFGRYRLRYQLGSGGMATVYLARVSGPAGFDKPVAIKRMHPHLARKNEYIDMFLDEARLTSRIDHPNVCTVFDFGEVDGSYFMAMEYLVGEPLTVVLAALQEKNAFDSPRWRAFAARIVADACEGLHAAHELRGRDGTPLRVVHRDVTPSNLFVTFDGAVKVVDFGVAKASGRLHQTTTGTLKGKFSYMSPEQVRGEEVDRRSDVFALGICLWEMLCGRRLFRRKTEMEMMNAVSGGEIPEPRSVMPRVPAALSALTMRALDRTPGTRFQTARDMGAALRDFLRAQDEPTALPDLAEYMDQLLLREHTAKLDIVRTVMSGSYSSARSHIAFASTAVLETPEKRGAGTGETTGPLNAATFGDSVSETRRINQPGDVAVSPTGLVTTTRSTLGRVARATGLPRWSVLVGGSVLITGIALAITIGAVIGLSEEPPPGAAPIPLAPQRVDDPEEEARVARTVEPSEPAPSSAPAPTEDPEEATAVEAEAPSESATPRRQRPGRVNITTLGGWADIYVRGRQLGRTPRQIDLPPGRHVIELRPFGRTPAQRVRVTVQSGGRHRVRVPVRAP